jgi:hypothetical protein
MDVVMFMFSYTLSICETISMILSLQHCNYLNNFLHPNVMVDYFVINPAMFHLHRRNATLVVDSRLEKKVQDIISAHTCFKEENIHTAPHTIVHTPSVPHWHNGRHVGHPKQNHHFHKSHGNKHGRNKHYHGTHDAHNSKPRIPISALSQIDPAKRELNSLLNKISKQNYHVITSKLMRIANADVSALAFISHVLIEKACHQECFAKIYFDILESLHKECPDIVNSIITEFIQGYRCSIEKDLDKLSQLECIDGYDTMCDFFKLKNVFAAKNRCIIILVSNKFYHGACLDEYIHFLLDVLEKTSNNHNNIDVLTQCLIDALKMSGDKQGAISEEHIKRLKRYRYEQLPENCGMNIKFKWMSLESMFESKN